MGFNITNSRYITDTGLYTIDSVNGLQSFWMDISNVQAYIYENDRCVDSLKYYNDKFRNQTEYYQIPLNYRSFSLLAEAGKEYKIIVKAKGFPDVSATTKIPNLVKIDKVDTTKIILEGTFEYWESNTRIKCDVEFTDPTDEKNYYMLYVYLKSNDFPAQQITFECNDPIVEENLDHGSIPIGVAFSDKSINGRKYKLPITLNAKDIGWPLYSLPSPPPPSGYPLTTPYKTTVYFKLYSITEDYFKYIRTLRLFLKNYGDPLAEPTEVYSNITGGYGIFAGAAVSTDSIVYHK